VLKRNRIIPVLIRVSCVSHINDSADVDAIDADVDVRSGALRRGLALHRIRSLDPAT
jgi:hypothetical protein